MELKNGRITLLTLFISPQFTHLFRGGKQFIEGPLSIDLPVFENNDMVGAAQDRSTMGDNEIGLFALCEKSFPESAFRPDIQSAREIIENEQFSRAGQHSRSSRTLSLPS